MIRESGINKMSTDVNLKVLFSDVLNPIRGINALRTDHTSGNLLVANNIVSNQLGDLPFKQVILHDRVENLELILTLTNQLRAQGGQIYPFLSYQLIGDRSPFAQPYFFLQGVGKVGDYTVTMKAIKPIDKQNLLSSFTVIF